MIPALGQQIDFCPSTAGFKSWRAMAFHPETRAFYIPLLMTCQKGTFADVPKVEGGGGLGQGRRENYYHPESGDNLAQFVAMDSATGRILWLHRQRAPFNTAALTTAGGLVFVGDWNRYINAYDVASGTLLWQNRLTTSPQGFPITYAVGGRQYVAVPVGHRRRELGHDDSDRDGPGDQEAERRERDLRVRPAEPTEVTEARSL